MTTQVKKNKNRQSLFYFLGLILLFLIIIFAYLFFLKRLNPSVQEESVLKDSSGRLMVTTASYPVFEFARVVGGDQATVVLILPPSVDLHRFVPTAETLTEIKQSAIFFYTSDILEPWVKELTLSNGFALGEGLETEDGDPHIWMDFSLAAEMVERISAIYQEIDPASAAKYQERARAYRKELEQLDKEFFAGLANCRWSELVVAGHDTFAYLARRYNLNYQALQGFIPDDTVDVDLIVTTSDRLMSNNQKYVFFEELIMPYLGSLMRQGAGVELLPLNAAHNVGRFDTVSGVTFLSLMRVNLETLRKGLGCE